MNEEKLQIIIIIFSNYLIHSLKYYGTTFCLSDKFIGIEVVKLHITS